MFSTNTGYELRGNAWRVSSSDRQFRFQQGVTHPALSNHLSQILQFGQAPSEYNTGSGFQHTLFTG
jgi:hypothetical protein